jgi:hypothetical protein
MKRTSGRGKGCGRQRLAITIECEGRVGTGHVPIALFRFMGFQPLLLNLGNTGWKPMLLRCRRLP